MCESIHHTTLPSIMKISTQIGDMLNGQYINQMQGGVQLKKRQCPGNNGPVCMSKRVLFSQNLLLSLKSWLLAPTENAMTPFGCAPPCWTMSHTNRLYHDTMMLTCPISPISSLMFMNSLSMDGSSSASAGWCTYSCSILPPYTDPVFFMSNITQYTGLCNHSAVDEPSSIGVAHHSPSC